MVNLPQNCDTKPVFTAKTDFIDRIGLLILCNLLKTQMCLKIPCYRNRGYPFTLGLWREWGLRGRMINTVKIVAPLTSLCVMSSNPVCGIASE